MVKPVPLFLIVVFSLLVPVRASTTEYNTLKFLVFKGADQIGTLDISQLIESSRITYTLTSDVSIDLIVEFNIEETIKDVFEKGYLKSSTHTRYVNETLRANNTLIRLDSVYKITDSDAAVKYIKENIRVSVLSLYFEEPVPGQFIYSENFRELVKLKEVAEHTFTVELPNGNITTYYYKNNRIQSVSSQTRFGIIKFICQK